ncbi:Kelch repeat-containing protein 2 [Candida viswanathii]|uniref:Kelch repeat-containing protein 2 n=1 Tax=Candida viswanathii TaxID=5486 RepID=A0A367Y437_9ASCO|nr:Kelch repeat-containing protein 2 [Candida viswanathii]
MARFRFGSKHKKKDQHSADVDPDSTVSTTASSIVSEKKRGSKRLTGILNTPPKQHQPRQESPSPQVPKPVQLSQPEPMPLITQQPKIIQQPPPSVVSPWKRCKLYDSPFPRYRHAAATSSSDKSEIFIMGGLKDGSVFGDTWKIYPDLVHGYVAQQIEVTNNNNPPARVGHSGVLCGNAFIIYGGDTVDTDLNGFPDNNFYLFNINNNKYTIPSHILHKPNGRYGHSVGVISLNNTSSRLYLFGGQLENDVYNDLYYFELNSFKSPKASWELVEPLNNFKPPPLTNHSMSVYKNKIYVFGGVYNNEKVSNDLWVFDATDDKWTQVNTVGDIPLPVNEHSSCVVDDKLYIYGGNDFSGIIYSSLYVLDLQTLEWTKLRQSAEENGPGPRCGHSMTLIPKLNKIVIMGGDKNDYIDSDPNNFETYETFNGEELGTMIYELDLNLVDYFMGSTPMQLYVADERPEELVEDEEFGRPRKVAASSRKDVQAHDHARSFSAGPEDFATPQASARGSPSPERRPGDNFVEVDLPSATISQIDDDTPYDPTYLNEPSVPQVEEEATKNNNRSDNNGDLSEPFRRRSLDPRHDESTTESGPGSGLSESVTVAPGIVAAGIGGAVAATAALGSGLTGNGFASKSENEPTHTFDNDDLSHSIGVPVQKSVDVAPLEPQHSDSKVKKIISELTNELVELKASTKEQMQRATEKIDHLERQNSLLQESQLRDVESYTKQLNEKDSLITELKSSLEPSAWDPEQPQSATNISELNRYKLERLELNNKLLYLEQENAKLHEKFDEFEPFMDHQIGELDKFQKVIKVQEEQIEKLTNQVRDQESLHREIHDWQSKHQNLQLEFDNYRAIHNDDEISDADTEVPNDDRSILSTAKSKKDISAHLENLVVLWSQKHNTFSRESSVAPGGEATPDSNPVVAKLQQQVDDLLRIGKQNEETFTQEIEALKRDLDEKAVSLKMAEDNYRESIQSVNNTSKALQLNQDELSNQRMLMEKLVKENNELKIFKKANSKRMNSRDATPIVNDFQQTNGGNGEAVQDDGDDEPVISAAHYNMKVKDLEADLYILKQERDQLKENVTSLQKQLYLAQNN